MIIEDFVKAVSLSQGADLDFLIRNSSIDN